MKLVRTADGTILVPSIDFVRHCTRCGVSVHKTDGEHLCKDIVGRLRAENVTVFAEYARELVELGGEG